MPEPELLGARYEVLRTVSEGRRASVLQALDRVHDRLVALKVYAVNGVDRDGLLAEARLLMRMAPHPALPVVRSDFFTDAGDRYVVVMNWVDGTNLQQLLEEQGDPGLPLQDVIDDLTHVADALDHLHAHEPPIIHGDVKPANLVRTASGGVVLVDFDIAGTHTGSGRFGTVGFVAPEVSAGEKPGPAADVYGLAATAVTLLNGHPPTIAIPTYPGIEPAEQGQLARVLRAGLAIDPTRRPRSARRLIDNLRTAPRADHPAGVVALLGTEVADAGRFWSEEPDEMRVAMARLRDLRDDVVTRRGGWVVTSMNEGDRTIAVFHEASAAALCAIELLERVKSEAFPPGIDIRLRSAIVVGEATFVDGVYTGAVVDQLLRLRSSAEPDTTITPEPTAELLIGLVGREASIVSLGTVATSAFPGGLRLFALTRPGAEHTAAAPVDRVAPTPHDQSLDGSTADGSRREPTSTSSAVVLDALQQPATLVALTAAGLAAIFLIVLSPELGFAALGWAALVVSVGAVVIAFGWHYRLGHEARRSALDAEREADERDARAHAIAHERSELRRRLELGFARCGTDDGREGVRVLAGLRDEFDSIAGLLHRFEVWSSMSLSPALTDLAEETYRRGVSALSDALELLEFADGPQRRRLEGELVDVNERLERDTYADDRARARDEQRRTSSRQLLARHDESRQRARDLLFEAERCTAALAGARIELASVRAGDAQLDVDVVVQMLQDTIGRVRDVQDELRRLGY